MWLVFLLERVAWLQILSSEDLVKQEDVRSLREEPIVGPRGMIEDRTGRSLAVSESHLGLSKNGDGKGACR